ncbi:MAG: alpha/beta hydrolase [Elusimicrobia bacterium]|nr:alpha/beta hydrolase [Elusimicrobiota bacterium]
MSQAISPLREHYPLVDGQMFCAARRPFSRGESVVVTIPGGPGLSGDYLQPFLAKLSEATALNTALLDLPNHGRSVIKPEAMPLTYSGCLKLLDSALHEISGKCGGIVLFGQSFGARLAFDLLATSGIKFRGAVLTGFPYQFEISKALLRKLGSLELEAFTGSPKDEEVFARNWRKLIPHYTAQPLATEVFEQLASGTRWAGNDAMIEAPPSLESVAAIINAQPAAATRVLILQGSADPVVPDRNTEALKRVIPAARFREVPEAGHFVMIEKPEPTLSAMADFIRGLGVVGA